MKLGIIIINNDQCYLLVEINKIKENYNKYIKKIVQK